MRVIIILSFSGAKIAVNIETTKLFSANRPFFSVKRGLTDYLMTARTTNQACIAMVVGSP